MLSKSKIVAMEKKYLLQNYSRADFVPVHGHGSFLFDADNKRYLDFVAGLAVNALGHHHHALLKAINDQASRFVHITNLYHYESHVRVAELLVKHSFADRVFFCNSGTEAVEAAIKFSRRYAFSRGQEERNRIVSFFNAFHGRTYGALAATPNKNYQRGFGPFPSAFKYVNVGDIKALKEVIDSRTAAVIIEPVQGESGVRPIPAGFLKELRVLCSARGVLLIFDEIQCGLGRTGRLWAYQHTDVTPDIMTLAKPLGGGLPLGAVLMKQEIADSIKPGDHGTTFGGNPVACAAAAVFIKTLLKTDFLVNVRRKGVMLSRGLQELFNDHPDFVEIRGNGLMWGVEMKNPVKSIIDKARANGLILCTAGPNVLRFLPPLNITFGQVALALRILKKTLMETA